MPRRAPPTPLRLVDGPLPPRNVPKHTLPSVPRPVFQPVAPYTRGPAPRARASSSTYNIVPHTLHVPQTPSLFVDITERGGGSNPSSPLSAESSQGSRSRPPSPVAVARMRGPWDHSGSIQVPFDANNILPPPKPAAVAPNRK